MYYIWYILYFFIYTYDIFYVYYIILCKYHIIYNILYYIYLYIYVICYIYMFPIVNIIGSLDFRFWQKVPSVPLRWYFRRDQIRFCWLHILHITVCPIYKVKSTNARTKKNIILIHSFLLIKCSLWSHKTPFKSPV